MEPYYRLLSDTDLYNDEMIRTFLNDTPNWSILTAREKELRALHLNCCVYLSNLERVTKVEDLNGKSFQVDDAAGPSKRLRNR